MRNGVGPVLSRALPEDDADLRGLLMETPIEGDIRVAFAREPSYFAATQVEGDWHDAIVVRHDGQVIAMGSRSEKQAWINGKEDRIGYLSSLRIRPEFRNRTLLARGYRELERRHRERHVAMYLSTIVSDNHTARRILTSGRAGLPTYRDLGCFHTVAVRPFSRSTSHPDEDGITIRHAQEGELDRILDYLSQNGGKRQFFPQYRKRDFVDGLLRGLRIPDVLIAVRSNIIVGCMAAWNQNDFKQYVVTGYSPRFAVCRMAWNGVATVLNRPRLPAPGQQLHYRLMAICCITDDDKDVFEALFSRLLYTPPQDGRCHAVLAGFHVQDPLLSLAEKWPHRKYTSRLYVVHWDDGESAFNKLDDRVPYVELGSL